MRKLKFFSMLALLLAIGQGARAYDARYNINTNGGNVVVGAIQDVFIEGTGQPTSNQILIKGGGTVTLSNVNISNVDYCIECSGNATIILEDGSVNTLTSTGDYSHDLNYGNHPALRVGSSGSTLTIKGGPLGTGILNANGSANHAAIGGGSYYSEHTCGNIRIEGGVINARGGEWAAAIGSDRYHNDKKSTCGDITITGGTVTAWGGINAAAIGSGYDGGCGNITITNGVAKVLAIKGTNAPYSIGKGKSEDQTSTCGTVTTNCTLDGSTPVGGQTGFIANNYAFVTTSEQLAEAAGYDNTDILLGADIDINSVLIIEKTTNLDLNGHTLTRTGAEGDKNNGWVVWVKTGGNLTIKDTGTDGTITGGYAYSGGGIWNDGTLRIEGGTISGNTVVDNDGGYGRGGGIYNASGATLYITGGTISGNKAVGNAHGGGGIYNDGTLTITGGTISDNEAYNGAGILNYGTLTIEGGTISGNTVVDNGGSDGRGGGIFNESGATLTITGGAISGNEAVGSAHGGAGIFNDGTMTISGGTVTGNTAAHGGGIKNYGTLNMEGAPVVSGNTGGDVWLGNGKVITCTGAFTGAAESIGIAMERVGAFTNGYGASGTTTNPFFASNEINDVAIIDGECRLRIGYYECSWDAENKRVVHTVQHADNVIYLTGGDNANLGENVTDSWYIVDGTINYSDRVWCYNNVHLILGDNAQMTIGHGLKVFGAGTTQNASLKIYSQSYGDAMGRLISHCDANDEAGIGSVASTKMGPVEFHGGYIEAEGDDDAAGIGGGKNANSDVITIYDGIIKATSGTDAAAIGGGSGGSAESITIYGGDVTADASTSSNFVFGAGIGGGAYESGGGGCGVINIWGGTVTAKGAAHSAGIGSGNTGKSGGEINIHGGTIVAYGGQDCGAGIGSGSTSAQGSSLPGGAIRISGGDVKAYGQEGGAGIGSYFGECNIEVSGGTVYAEGSYLSSGHDYYGAGIGGVNISGQNPSGGSVTISGGDVTAVGALRAINYVETITIGTEIQVRAGDDETDATLQLAANRVTACQENEYAHIEPCSHSEAAFTIVDGFYHHSNGCDYCLLSSDESQAHAFVGDANQCICGLHELKDNADNTTMIQALATSGETVPVVLNGRTLLKDGSWNTLCLPFGIEGFSGTPLDGATVKELDNSASGTSLTDGTLTLKFTEATSIEAGKPYIVKWTTTGDDITNPVFSDVTVSSTAEQEVTSTDTKVKFVGQYSPFDITDDNINEILYVASGNKIGYSKNARTLKSCRAHFWVKPNGTAQAVHAINIGWGDGEATGINSLTPNLSPKSEGSIYTIDGRKLSDVPTTKGVYIVNGRKIVVK